MEFIFAILWFLFSLNNFSYVFTCFLYVYNLKFTPIQQSTALPPLLSDLRANTRRDPLFAEIMEGYITSLNHLISSTTI